MAEVVGRGARNPLGIGMVSVIIPARNEVYLERTIRSVLDAAEGDVEVIAVLDGYLPDPPIDMKDDRVIFLSYPESVGQRHAINEGARRARGEYVLKLDAHCAVDQGFDVKLKADCEYNWTVIPRMYNLDVKTWQAKLLNDTKTAIRKGKLHDYMYVGWNDKGQLRTLYYTGAENKRWHEKEDLIDDTMSCMGPCFFMHKERFWELGGCDEGHGGWGQQGVEVACKAFLSGGRLVVNKKTWFAHWFRGNGPGFPYPISGNDQDRAREYSQGLWLNDKWPLQKRSFRSLVEQFNPPTWQYFNWENKKLIGQTPSVKPPTKLVTPALTAATERQYYDLTLKKHRPTWLGVPVIKYPQDLFLYQQIIVENKPDFIVETGTERGGSSLFFASVCDMIGHGQVITIDIKDWQPPPHPRITHLIGRSTSTEILAKVKELVGDGSVMVSLDSDHHRAHVKRELLHYGRIVTPGQYMVVEDTNYPTIRRKGSYVGGPDEAVKWYLAKNKNFVDQQLEKRWLFSCQPGGWLRKR